MRILVLDVAASESGALTILNQFYDEVRDSNDANKWFFLVSTPKLLSTNKIEVLNFPWIKKSWFHRLLFDKFYLNKIIKKYKIDFIFSLQNIIVEGSKIPQALYLHTPLPFTNIKFPISKYLNFWIYQNILSNSIYNSIKKANLIIVQTEWMKNACTKIKKDINIVKIPPIVDDTNIIPNNGDYTNVFLYPSTCLSYKNHQLIIEACHLLKKQGYENYQVYFTFKKDSCSLAKNLFEQVEALNLPIKFIGVLKKEELMKLYSQSIILFPSYLETFGLPLLEGKLSQCIILASETEFSNEILKGYENAYFYDYKNAEELKNLMIRCLEKSISYNNVTKKADINKEKIIDTILNFLENKEGA